MRTPHLALAALACVACLGTAAGAPVQHVHEHGRATLNVAVEGGRLVIELDSPAIDVFGFERAPRTTEETRVVVEMTSALRSGRGLFLLPMAAACRMSAVSVEFPDWDAAPEHDHHDDDVEEHHDVRASYTIGCASARHLAWIDVPLVRRLRPGVRLQANVITGNSQSQATLSSSDLRLRLE